MADDRRSMVYETMQKILSGLLPDTSQSKKILSMLRHSVSMEIGEDPELFGWLLENIPDELKGEGKNVSYAELAIYTALTLYPEGPEHTPDSTGIASAVKAADIKREMLIMAEMADTISSARHPLRAVMQLLKSKGQSIDYRILARDLYDWQFDRIKVARKWEREYARKEKKNEQ